MCCSRETVICQYECVPCSLTTNTIELRIFNTTTMMCSSFEDSSSISSGLSCENLDDISTDDLTGSSLGDPQFAAAIALGQAVTTASSGKRAQQHQPKVQADQLLKLCRGVRGGVEEARPKSEAVMMASGE
jgi:hypothetical protein